MTDVEKLMLLFQGFKDVHGTYETEAATNASGKKKGKGRTVKEPATLDLWEQHVRAEYSVGIVPINQDNQCYWGAIDIDEYVNFDVSSFAKVVYKKDLPLIPFRSKSGGCHLMMFFIEPVEAKKVQDKLAEIAANLGYAQCEIFPKQTTLIVERGDMGNWLNMPYFGGENTTRYALDENGAAMPLRAFLSAAEDAKVTEGELDDLVIEKNQALNDGPPCLQTLVGQGFPDGTRNNGLFNLGVYARSAFSDSWEAKVDEFNNLFMDPPLESKEVTIVIKQLAKKDYGYKCSDQPICNFCNIALCRTRKFGIGGSSIPTLSGLAKLPTDQPIWFLDVNSSRLELSTEQLQNQTLFQRACMNSLNLMPPRMSDKQWTSIIQTLMNSCDMLPKPKDGGLAEHFAELVAKFCTDAHRNTADSRDQVALGKAWEGDSPDSTGHKRVYFKLSSLEEFLVRNNFKYLTRTQIITRLQSDVFEGKPYFFNIKGKGINVWHIKEQEKQTEPYDLPDMQEDTL